MRPSAAALRQPGVVARRHYAHSAARRSVHVGTGRAPGSTPASGTHPVRIRSRRRGNTRMEANRFICRSGCGNADRSRPAAAAAAHRAPRGTGERDGIDPIR
ncbi:hypothetical protein C6V04_17980 [Burkholderia multivorans]|nr:hypothetical protein C6V04_17980 [Burkholderia multivorans]